MNAYLLRSLGGDKYCILLEDTNAIVCAACPNSDPSFCGVSPYKPLSCLITLGEYQVRQSYYKDSILEANCTSITNNPKTTIYKCIKKK
jgi:hypothetical protein